MRKMKNEKWAIVLNQLKYTHTISGRDICQTLKCSRSWASRYVFPMVPHIKLDNGSRIAKDENGKRVGGGIPWVAIAAMQIKYEDPNFEREIDVSQSNWYCTADFEDLIRQSIVSVTKQTKQIPVELLIEDLDAYQAERETLEKDLEQAIADKAYLAATQIKIEIEYLWRRHLTSTGKTIAKKHMANITKRRDAHPVQVDISNLGDITTEDVRMRWIAPHDAKSYGDTDEMIGRRFFREGMIRVQLALPDRDGVAGTKVYYISDPEPIGRWFVDQYVLITEAGWQEFQDYFHDAEKKLLFLVGDDRSSEPDLM